MSGFSTVPTALRERDNWVCYRLEPYTTDVRCVDPETGDGDGVRSRQIRKNLLGVSS